MADQSFLDDTQNREEEEDTEGLIDLDGDRDNYNSIIGTIKARFSDAETGRRNDETRWLTAYKNYRGIYDSSTQYRDNERSQVFVKITKTKVLAAYGQIIDILFANNKFPISVESTPMPTGIDEFAHLSKVPVAEEPTDMYGFEGDGKELLPGAMQATASQEQPQQGPQAADLGGLASKYEGANLASGPARMGEPQISPAAEAARVMEKCIQDQLLDTNAVTVLRHAIFECSLLGTGIIKGPFNYNKTVHNWEGGEYKPIDKTVPRIEAVSCWDFYPDSSATSIEDADYVIQRHRMNREQLRDLSNRPFFNKEGIDNVLQSGPNYQEKYYETTLNASNDDPNYTGSRFEVLEYWGILDAKFAEEIGIELPKEIKGEDSVQVNIWVSGNQILRFVANPFLPTRIPYRNSNQRNKVSEYCR